MLTNNEKHEIRAKLRELETHYIIYKKLIDAGLVIAVVDFATYLKAVEFDKKSLGKQYKIFISSVNDDEWEI